MKTIARLKQIGVYNELEVMPDGDLCLWSDVEALQKELQDVTAKALAAIWLLPEDTNIADLYGLYTRAKALFSGEDQARIAKLQDEIENLRESFRRMKSPPAPGVAQVYARDLKTNTDRILAIFEIRHDTDGHAHIGVYLP